MKKLLSALMAAVLLVGIIGVSAEPQIGALENLARTHLSSMRGVNMLIPNGTVDYSDRFDSQGAFSVITDGNTDAHGDVHGALDWPQPQYVGVLFTFESVYYVQNATIYSGYAQLPERYRVYASDSLETLYTSDCMAADGILCTGSAVDVLIQKKVKYIAFFCTEYKGNQRVKELEVWGNTQSAEDDTVLSTAGNQIMMGNKPICLRGVNIPQFSWSSYGDGSTQEGESSADIALKQVLEDWQCSLVRLAVDPKLYVSGGVGSGNGQTVSRSAEEYRALIDRFITTLTSNNIPVVLDCHAYAGVYQEVIDFWDIAAPKYDGNELVMYGLLNEPVSDWTVWYEGGTLPFNGEELTCIGLPALLDRIREVSDNVAVIGGIDWAFDLSGTASDNFAKLAQDRSDSLGITVDEYYRRYALTAGNRKGRGIVLDTHIYSNKPLNWYAAVGEAAKEYPILVGEYNPYFRSGVITDLTAQENAFLQKIFGWITENGFSSASWALGAEPYLTDHSGNITALGEAVRTFVKTGEWTCGQEENLIYRHFASASSIYQGVSSTAVGYNGMFCSQAYQNDKQVGEKVLEYIIDGDTASHFDIYPWDGFRMGVQYVLDDVYACSELRMTSGLEGYPDKYRLYVSDKLENLYSQESLVEDFTVDHSGTVRYTFDRAVKYAAFLADGYVRIREFSLTGVRFGDLNSDSKIDAADLAGLRKCLLGSESASVSGDINRDGKIDLLDLVALKKKLIK